MVDVSPIPPTWKLPGVSVTVDPSQAGTPFNRKWALIADYMLPAASAQADVPVAAGSVAQVEALVGAGSPLARAYAQFFAINPSTPAFILPITPPSSGVAATGTITVTSAATIAGTLALYVAGQKVPVGIGSGDSTAQIATKIAAAINAATRLPVTAVASTNTVALTARWKGLTGNDVRVEDSYRGVNGGEALPTGLALTYPTANTLSGGTGTPDWSAAIGNLGDQPYKFVAMGHADAGSLAAWGVEYGFSDSGRWGWMRQSYGQVFSAERGTYSGLVTKGPTRNDPVIYPMAFEVQAPTPVWEVAAMFAAQAARGFTADPARPLQTLTLDGMLPAPRAFRFSKTQLNALAGVGYAIQGTDVDGNTGGIPQILREQSSYQNNAYGQPDNAYELATTLATLDEVLTRLRQAISSKYGRHKLANDGTRFGPGQAIVTPRILMGELVAEYDLMEYDGLVENVRAFKGALVVERSSTEPNTVNVLYPPDLINGLRRFNVRAQFRLQFPTSLLA